MDKKSKKHKKGPPYLSYSGFSKYETCPEAYHLEYVLRERPEIEDERNSFTGSALHKLLEDYIGLGEDNPEWLIKNAVDYWESERDNSKLIVWRHDQDGGELLAKMKKWSISLADLVVQAKIKPHQWASEMKADSDVRLNGEVFRLGGRIDMMRKKDNGDVFFFDLKGSENKSIMKLDQIVWYSVLLGVHLGDMNQPVAGGYLLPGFNEIKMYKISEEKKLELLNRVYGAFKNIQDEKWSSPPGGCKDYWCLIHGGGRRVPLEVKNGIVDLGGV